MLRARFRRRRRRSRLCVSHNNAGIPLRIHYARAAGRILRTSDPTRYGEEVLRILVASGRALLRCWPTLLAWYLGSVLAHFAVIQVAGFVGGHTAVGGLSILPLAVLTRLIGYVGMFLVARNALFPRSRARSARAWLDDFWRALGVGILPFYAVYAAWGGLREDILDYASRALTAAQSQIMAGEDGSGPKELIFTIGTGFWTVAVILIAFVARWLLNRSAERRPRWTVIFEVYLETIWVFFFVVTVQDLLTGAFDWLGTRRVGTWTTDLHDWILTQFGWIGAAWNWVWGEGGSFILAPLGWLAVAGILAFVADANDLGGLDAQVLGHRYVIAARHTHAKAPGWLRRVLGSLGDDWRERMVPFAAAVLRMWRAGPVFIASYLFLYAAVRLVQPGLDLLLVQLIGPQDFGTFWSVFDQLLFLVSAVVAEPIRIALITGTQATIAGPATLVQGETENRANSGRASITSTSTQNGPAAS